MLGLLDSSSLGSHSEAMEKRGVRGGRLKKYLRTASHTALRYVSSPRVGCKGDRALRAALPGFSHLCELPSSCTFSLNEIIRVSGRYSDRFAFVCSKMACVRNALENAYCAPAREDDGVTIGSYTSSHNISSAFSDACRRVKSLSLGEARSSCCPHPTSRTFHRASVKVGNLWTTLCTGDGGAYTNTISICKLYGFNA